MLWQVCGSGWVVGGRADGWGVRTNVGSTYYFCAQMCAAHQTPRIRCFHMGKITEVAEECWARRCQPHCQDASEAYTRGKIEARKTTDERG